MGALSEIAAEREEELNATREVYQAAYTAMEAYRDAHPPAHRKSHEADELSRLSGICGLAKLRYDTAKSALNRL